MLDRNRRWTWLLGAAVLALAAARPVAADYPEKNFDMIIPYGGGGGFDTYARVVGRMMEKHMQRGLRVIPRNLPGAGSRRGTAALYRAAPDGYTLGILNLPGAVEAQILGEETQYDLDKMTWLGVVNIGVYTLIAGRSAGLASLADLRRPDRPVWFATTGSNDHAMAKIMADTLRLNIKYITGYKSAPEGHLAIARGEADAGMGSDVTIASQIKAGDLKPLLLFQTQAKRLAFPGVPTVAEIGHPELANLQLYRLFAAPPALPTEIREKLAALVQTALNDPEFAEWSKAADFPIDPGTGADAERMYREQRVFLTRYKHLLKAE